MLDQRQSIRRRTLLEGRIGVERLNGWALDCSVRNLSRTGARVRLPADALVPEMFELKVSDAAPVWARLVWYQNGEAGLEIGAPVDTPCPTHFTGL